MSARADTALNVSSPLLMSVWMTWVLTPVTGWYPPRSYPGDGRRQLPPKTKPPQTITMLRTLTANQLAPTHARQTRRGGVGPLPQRSSAPIPRTFTICTHHEAIDLTNSWLPNEECLLHPARLAGALSYCRACCWKTNARYCPTTRSEAGLSADAQRKLAARSPGHSVGPELQRGSGRHNGLHKCSIRFADKHWKCAGSNCIGDYQSELHTRNEQRVPANLCSGPLRNHGGLYSSRCHAAGPRERHAENCGQCPGEPSYRQAFGQCIFCRTALALSQPVVSFGNQTVSTASAPQVVYLTDLGSAGAPQGGPASRVQINSIKLGGTNAADFTETETCGGSLGFTIAGRKGCMISVAFALSASSLGKRTASVTITPATGSPLVIQLVGVGIAAAPTVTLLPGNLTFATRPVGSASAAQILSVTNTGTAPLSVSQIATTRPSEFSIVSDGCSSQKIPPGSHCLVSVSFNPAAPGALNATPQLVDSTGKQVKTASLSGTGAKLAHAIAFRFQEKPGVGIQAIKHLATSTSGLPVEYAILSGSAVLEGTDLKAIHPSQVVIRTS